MAAMRKVSLRAVCFALCLTTCAAVARAQEAETQSPADAQRSENYYYQQPNYQPNPRAIIHQKAIARSAQRDARLASLNWYGMYNAQSHGGADALHNALQPRVANAGRPAVRMVSDLANRVRANLPVTARHRREYSQLSV